MAKVVNVEQDQLAGTQFLVSVWKMFVGFETFVRQQHVEWHCSPLQIKGKRTQSSVIGHSKLDFLGNSQKLVLFKSVFRRDAEAPFVLEWRSLQKCSPQEVVWQEKQTKQIRTFSAWQTNQSAVGHDYGWEDMKNDHSPSRLAMRLFSSSRGTGTHKRTFSIQKS